MTLKVLAIGASGFIGRHIVRLLVTQGIEVAVLHRGEAGAELPNEALHIRGNRNHLGDARAELARFAPDVVLDVVPYTEQQARGIVQIFRDIAGRVVALSSADVYRNYDGFRGKSTAEPDDAPLAESAPLRETRYPYRGSGLQFEYANDYEKILVEDVLLTEPALPATLLRLSAVYGPGDTQHRARTYLQQMLGGRRRILLQVEQAAWRWSRCFVENVAAQIVLAVTNDHRVSRVFNVGDELALSELQWVERIGAAAGWSREVVAVCASELPNHLKQRFDWRYDLWTDTSSIRQTLGYIEPTPLDEALVRTVKWERSMLEEAKSAHRLHVNDCIGPST